MKVEDHKCSWRKVAESDLEKKAKGNDCITLPAQQKCYDCNGYNMECRSYYAIKKKQEPRSYSQNV